MGVEMVPVPLHMPVIPTSCHITYGSWKGSSPIVLDWSACHMGQKPPQLSSGWCLQGALEPSTVGR